MAARFTAFDGAADETLGVELDHYAVNWRTGEASLTAGAVYRIRVLLDDTELGYVDIE